jgi:hypothetical protein
VCSISPAGPAVLAGALLLTAAGCSEQSVPVASAPSGTPTVLAADCVEISHGGQHLALDVVDGLHPLDPDRASLNADFVVDDDLTVEQVAWVLLGARLEKDADGVVYVWATDRTPSFPAVRSMRRTIFESAGSVVEVGDLDLGRTRVAGRPAATAAVTGPRGDYDAWTFTSGRTRFIVYSHQRPAAGPFDLARRVPSLLSPGGCDDG